MNKRDIDMGNDENDYINQRDKNYLFVIGIDKYNKQFAKELSNAAKDSKDFKKILEDGYNFKCIDALYNEKATRKNIINALNNIPAIIGKTVEYNLVIYFAGHGKVINNRGVLIPVDYDGEHDSYISYDDLLGIIRYVARKHLLLILDCCFAGSVFENHRGESISRLEQKKSRWGLVSSMNDERASDGNSNENSPFAETILNYLRKPSSKTFTVYDLVSYTISKKLAGQNPEAGILANCGDENGCFRLYHNDYKPNIKIYPPSYIDDTNVIKFIIDRTTITESSKHIILDYIKNSDYEQFFWKELSNPEWLPVLKSEMFFDVSRYPKPILQENGELNHPFWFVLIYMKKMAEQRKKPELIQEAANFILQISNYSTENARINEYFIGLLGCFPKEFISLELLDFLPKWCENSLYFRLNLITESILPKFFEETEDENTAKIEKILSFILGLKKVKQIPQTFSFFSTVENTEEKEVYKDIYENDHYYIKRLFLNNKDKIANNISDEFIFELAQNIKKLLLEKVEPTYYNNFKINDSVFQLVIRISENILFYTLLADNKVIIEEKGIEDYENLGAIEIANEIQASFKPLPIEDNFSISLTTFIEKMQLGYYWILNEDNVFEQEPNGYNSQEMYIWILKEILIHREEKTDILRSFYNSPKFSFKIFKQLLLYIIAQDWKTYSFLFWELIGKNDDHNIFPNYVYEKHLHKLLNTNTLHFDNEQCELLNHIIDTSLEKLKREEDGYQSYWQLQMYFALQTNPYFKEKYENLSKVLNLNIEESISPIQQEDNSFALTIRELSQKTNEDIANYIINSTQNSTPYELNRILRELVSLQPQKFLADFKVFLTLPDTHIIAILAYLKNAWLEGKEVDWQQIISFIQLYISEEREDDSYSDITSILEAYLNDKSERFDSSLFPQIKQVLFETGKFLKVAEIKENYSLHDIFSSSYGNWTNTLLNYALKYAKITYQEKPNELIKWEEDIRNAFEKLIAEDIPEIHIQIGLFFGNFYYLDKDWLLTKVEMYKNSDNEKIQEYFIRGFFDGGTNPWGEGYSLLLPLYKKAIINKWYKNQNLVTHIVSFLFWNIDKLEDENSLINTYLSHADEDSLGNLISELSADSTISYKVRYVKKEEWGNFELNILKLFKAINQKIFELEITNSRRVASYFLLLKYFQELNSGIVEFIRDLLKIGNEPYVAGLYERLLPFIKGDNYTFTNAQNIEKILSFTTPSDYIETKEQANLLQLFQFMHKYKSSNEDFKLKFDTLCSKFVKKGYEFLRKLYD